RQLSSELGINPNTIQKAYRLMEQEGLIYAQPGRGNFVTPRVSEQRKKQQEAQMVRVEEAIRKAREMGIREEVIQEVIRKIYVSLQEEVQHDADGEYQQAFRYEAGAGGRQSEGRGRAYFRAAGNKRSREEHPFADHQRDY
ncbi:MAG: GntR family transcriptional regulator, partial [Clostridia bacterium]|nr:GntR family transcriptional regulator [Clostridia bacterium]